MLKSYVNITLRNIQRQRGYALLNITGLAVGMACCILILLWVQDEISYDRFHQNRNRIYRITYAEEIGGVYEHYAMSPFVSAPTFTEELPEVVTYTRFIRNAGLITSEEKKFDEAGIAYADSDFFKIFTYKFLEGDGGEGVPVGLLKAGAAVVFNTANTPQQREQEVFGDPLQLLWKNCIFDLCGVKRFYRRMFTVIVTSTPDQRRRWLAHVEQIMNDYFPAE